jgi:hypothetical protein
MKVTAFRTLLALSLFALACDDDTVQVNQDIFQATLTGAAERPTPVTTNATGTATVTLNTTSKTFSYVLTQSGLTGITAAHIHGPATTEQFAGVIVPLTAPTTSPTTGTFAAAQITATGISVDSLIALMRAGRTYVNIHTSANTAGAIRGQLILQ